MKKATGYIYILTNPAFPEYVKIGYADNVESRLQQLNRSECIPFAFRVYATYEVPSRLLDKKLHYILDALNPNLRSKEIFNGQIRRREFYAMQPEEAYSILEAMAEIHGCTDKLHKRTPSPEELIEEEIAEEIAKEKRVRGSNFTFSEYNLPAGAIFEHIDDPNITCTVIDDRRIEFNGEIMYITPFAKMVSGKNYITQGPKYLLDHFKYNGRLLRDFCEDLDTTDI